MKITIVHCSENYASLTRVITQVKRCTKHGRPDQSQRKQTVALSQYGKFDSGGTTAQICESAQLDNWVDVPDIIQGAFWDIHKYLSLKVFNGHRYFTSGSPSILNQVILVVHESTGNRGGALNLFFFFQFGVCSPDFRSVGLVNWYLPLKNGACELKISKFGGLWTENFLLWGLVSWKFPNLGACELKFGWKLRL